MTDSLTSKTAIRRACRVDAEDGEEVLCYGPGLLLQRRVQNGGERETESKMEVRGRLLQRGVQNGGERETKSILWNYLIELVAEYLILYYI